jgi:hypothetical protein
MIALQQLSMFAAHLLFQMPLEDEQSKQLTHCLQAFSFLKPEGVAGSEREIHRSFSMKRLKETEDTG